MRKVKKKVKVNLLALKFTRKLQTSLETMADKLTIREVGRAHSPAGSELRNNLIFLFLAALVVV